MTITSAANRKPISLQRQNASIERRLAFAIQSRLFYGWLATRRPIARLLRHLNDVYRVRGVFPRIPDRLSVATFDVLESLRIGRLVEWFGHPQIAAVQGREQVRQHPRFRRYWYDPNRSVEIGMYLGGDFVRHNGRYYPVELGLDPAMFIPRRALYAEMDVDPVVTTLVEDAVARRFEHLFLFHKRWRPDFRLEFEAVALTKKIDLTIGSIEDLLPNHPIPALPPHFPDRTLCVVFHGQRGPIDYFVSNKCATSVWLQEECQNGQLLGVVRSSGKPFAPPLKGQWPNLVIKRGAADFGRSVVFAKVCDAEQAIMASQEADRSLGGKWFHEVKAKVFQTNKNVYQEFIPPEQTKDGYLRIIRAHFLFTPNRSLFLSCHYVVSAHKPPETIEAGRIYRAGLVVNRNVGGHYERTNSQTESDFQVVAEELGKALRSAITKRFLIHD